MGQKYRKKFGTAEVLQALLDLVSPPDIDLQQLVHLILHIKYLYSEKHCFLQ